MKLIALLIGLLIERLATQLFHLRELRWLDRVIDAGCARTAVVANWPAIIPVTLLAALLVLPVLVVMLLLGKTLFSFPYLVIAVVVLFFSLGPKDIGEEVDDYCSAIESGDDERIRQTARALVEQDVSDDPWQRTLEVEQAVFAQANNRLFAVIFWFVLLGPLGAWAYRVTDLIRRRAHFKASRAEQTDGHESRVAEAAARLHAFVAWIPARLTAFGYALVGSFDDALAAWRAVRHEAAASSGALSERLLGRVGTASLALSTIDDESVEARAIRGAGAANRMVFRLLVLWAVLISGLTLYGWSL